MQTLEVHKEVMEHDAIKEVVSVTTNSTQLYKHTVYSEDCHATYIAGSYN